MQNSCYLMHKNLTIQPLQIHVRFIHRLSSLLFGVFHHFQLQLPRPWAALWIRARTALQPPHKRPLHRCFQFSVLPVRSAFTLYKLLVAPVLSTVLKSIIAHHLWMCGGRPRELHTFAETFHFVTWAAAQCRWGPSSRRRLWRTSSRPGAVWLFKLHLPLSTTMLWA